LDEQRFEVRKVEVFRNERCGYATADEEVGGTGLGVVAVPELAEIAKDPEFEPAEITKDEFEQVWKRRKSQE
jgi:hypothetical protein